MALSRFVCCASPYNFRDFSQTMIILGCCKLRGTHGGAPLYRDQPAGPPPPAPHRSQAPPTGARARGEGRAPAGGSRRPRRPVFFFRVPVQNSVLQSYSASKPKPFVFYIFRFFLYRSGSGGSRHPRRPVFFRSGSGGRRQPRRPVFFFLYIFCFSGPLD